MESRLERIAKLYKTKTNVEADKKLMEKCKAALEEQTALRYVSFTDDEKLLLRAYSFYTMKPVIVVANLSEDSLLQMTTHQGKLEKYCENNILP